MSIVKGGIPHEGAFISEADLRKVQDYSQEGERSRDLRESQAQAETGIKFDNPAGRCLKGKPDW